MRTKEVRLNMTPITESTFKRQGWVKVLVGDGLSSEEDENAEDYYFTLPLPKNRDEKILKKIWKIKNKIVYLYYEKLY